MVGLLLRRQAIISSGTNQPQPTYRELDGITFDGDVYYKINDFHLGGDDTLRFSIIQTANCNIIGCYTDADSTTNFSLYSSSSTSGRYLRHGSFTARGRIYFNSKKDITIGPTGSSGFVYANTWEQEDFVSTAPFCIGTTSDNVSSSYLLGTIIGRVVIDNRETFIPVERENDGAIGYLRSSNNVFYTNLGSGTPTEYIEE